MQGNNDIEICSFNAQSCCAGSCCSICKRKNGIQNCCFPRNKIYPELNSSFVNGCLKFAQCTSHHIPCNSYCYTLQYSNVIDLIENIANKRSTSCIYMLLFFLFFSRLLDVLIAKITDSGSPTHMHIKNEDEPSLSSLAEQQATHNLACTTPQHYWI